MNTGIVVEDLEHAQRWLHAVLHAAFPGIEVRIAGNVAEANRLLDAQMPDIALVDLGLPDGSGLEVLARLNSASPQTLCVVTTVFDDDEHLFSALRAGAHGYILKDQGQDKLVQMLQGIAHDQPPLSPPIAQRLLNFFRQPTPDPVTDLTPRELDVLTLIAKGFTTGRVAEMLGITRNTAAGYVKEVYRKLNVSSRAEAALEANRRGIVTPE